MLKKKYNFGRNKKFIHIQELCINYGDVVEGRTGFV